MKDELGVALRTTVEAIRMLSAEGTVSVRRKSGVTVNALKTTLRNGRVLLIIPGGLQLREEAIVFERLGLALNAAGYQVTLTSVFRRPSDGRFDFAQLKVYLQQTLELVVTYGANNPSLIRLISRSGHPFVVINGPATCARGFIGNITRSSSAAMDAFVNDCVRAKLKKVAVVVKYPGDSGVAERLRSAGIRTEEWVVSAPVGPCRCENLMRAAFELFERRLLRRTLRLPDLFYFTDDFCLQGAIVSLLGRGVRLPGDVRLVSVASRGFLPAIPASLARMEYDPYQDGDRAARAVLEYLRTGVFPIGLVSGPSYVRGLTFAV